MRVPAFPLLAMVSCAASLLFVPTVLAQQKVRPAATATTAATRVDRRLAIEGLTEPVSNLKVSDFAGRDITDKVKLKADGNRVTATLAHEQVVVKPKNIATVALATRGKTTLPGGIVVPLASPQAGGMDTTAWFRLTLEASPLPASWDNQTDGYVTRLTFGLKRPPQIPETIGLQEPVIIKLAYDGLNAGELPPLTLEGAGLQNEKTVELRFLPLTATPKLLVRSTISDADLPLSALARLAVRAQQKSMLGFGLETVPVLIENVLPYGEAQAVERATPISLQLEGGARLETIDPVFAAGASAATVHVRSSGVGAVVITATANGLTGRDTIEQRFPTGPLIAMLVGAALGGYARRFVKGARRGRSLRQITEGIIVGLVAFVAGVLGVGYLNLPPAIVATEAGAFLVGALAAFGGVSVLETLTKKNVGGP